MSGGDTEAAEEDCCGGGQQDPDTSRETVGEDEAAQVRDSAVAHHGLDDIRALALFHASSNHPPLPPARSLSLSFTLL